MSFSIITEARSSVDDDNAEDKNVTETKNVLNDLSEVYRDDSEHKLRPGPMRLCWCALEIKKLFN